MTAHRWLWDEDEDAETWHCLDCAATDTAHGQPGPAPEDGQCKGKAAFISQDFPWGHVGEDGGGLDEIVIRPTDTVTIDLVHLERMDTGLFSLVVHLSDGTGRHVDLCAPEDQPRTVIGTWWEDA
ncbi:hypothetical protein [Frankia sp. AgW1.1]|uniref:hypothetical protein n=1 Tax=Frankia sp. AgW1.1 TaxID=1836971 RepID=UPI0019342913|nr:hypothetical protein [Frankia sp. AgW1.1]MBL7487118.1 hypothetical protein [Frankia sp. AgW1.1]